MRLPLGEDVTLVRDQEEEGTTVHHRGAGDRARPEGEEEVVVVTVLGVTVVIMAMVVVTWAWEVVEGTTEELARVETTAAEVAAAPVAVIPQTLGVGVATLGWEENPRWGL